MKIFLLLIPLITTVLGLFLYKFQAKKIEIFKLDLVQFVYLFIIAPTMFVWTKSFIFYILRNELEFTLSVTDLFVIDTAFSVLALLIMSAIAIHSLTKTFWIKRHENPKFDVFHLSEYFHLWWSHIIIWGGGLVLGTFMSVVNVVVPLEIIVASKFQFYTLFVVGSIFGALVFLGIWISDPGQGNFMRLMKLFLAFFLVIHILIYFVFDPVFNMSHGVYWFMLATLVSAVLAASTFERYEKTSKFRKFLVHVGWGENRVDIFKTIKSKIKK